LKAPGTKRLKLKYEQSLSNVAFNFNLRRYTTVTALEECEFATLDRRAYDRTMRAEDISRIHAVTEFLSKCAMFRTWTKARGSFTSTTPPTLNCLLLLRACV